MKDIIEDLLKIYISCIDSYNIKLYQTINDKYTVIDRSMLTLYLYIKIIEDSNDKSEEALDVLYNYLFKQTIYSETGNISFEIEDTSKIELYNEILNKLVIEKFSYKNRIMKKLKYNYKDVKDNQYTELLSFLEIVSEYSMFQKLIQRGNIEATPLLEKIKNKIISYKNNLNEKDYFYKEKVKIIELIENNEFENSQYGKLNSVALNLKDVYRYSSVQSQLPENVLFHQFAMTIISIMITDYCHKTSNDKIDLYTIITKTLFHDFGEYKGTEIITHFKNYNETTKKMFASIEDKDEKDLESQIGNNLYLIISNYKKGPEGYVADLLDKIIGLLKIWIEVGYLNNNFFIKLVDSIFQERFKRFLRIEDIEELENKSFYLELLRETYIYIKENLINKDIDYFLMYYTEDELETFNEEIKCLKNTPNKFLNM